MDAIEQLGELVKGQARGGKYYRRVATGNKKRPYRYYYTKAAYDKVHGDAGHKDGPSEKKLRVPKKLSDRYAEALSAAERHGGVTDGGTYMSYSTGTKLRAKGFLELRQLTAAGKEALEDHQLATNIEHEKWGLVPREHWPEFEKKKWPMGKSETEKSMDPIDELGELVKAPPLPDQNSAGAKRSRTPAAMMMQRMMGSYEPAKKSEDMTPRTINPDHLSKGMHSFYDHDGKMQKIKDAYLSDYVDAFLEEAFEHERSERIHTDSNLLPAQANPAGYMAQCVYNELCAMCAHNKNLARAKEVLNITPVYVEGRLREAGLIHIDTANHESNNMAAIAGYHPTPMTLSRDAWPGEVVLGAAADAERNAAIHQIGTLRKTDEMVTLAPGDNPMAELRKATEAQVQHFSERFGTEVPTYGTLDERCPFHGDPHKIGLEKSSVQGAVCTCD